jgi:AraC family transcriptional regulator of adaptative response/methylated-DNA-[protein]-cysteine methyltransferase
MSDYERIARAIDFFQQRLTQQPGLDELAAHLALSPFHCQRLFARWAGTTPKRFLQVLTLELGKHLLDAGLPVLEASHAAGLSSSSRLYDHFVQIEAVTPGEYRAQGAGLQLEHAVVETPFGALFVARSPRGVCRAEFVDGQDEDAALRQLQAQWPQASCTPAPTALQSLADGWFGPPTAAAGPLKLHVQGTNFQLAVWRALLRIPPGTAVHYGAVAAAAGKPAAARATGTAIGANPVAVLIPCHRVIRQSGALGGYRWGLERKLALQAWERIREPGASQGSRSGVGGD